MNLSLNLDPYFYREYDSDVYLIPGPEIDAFDALTNEIDSIDDESELYAKTDEFNEKYLKYRVEGNLYDVVLWINPEQL